MYILSVEGVTILPVETAEEIAEWLLKTPLILEKKRKGAHFSPKRSKGAHFTPPIL